MATLKFGKHAGKTVAEIAWDKKYIKWLATTNSMPGKPGEKKFEVPKDVEAEAKALLGGSDNSQSNNDFGGSGGGKASRLDDSSAVAAIIEAIENEGKEWKAAAEQATDDEQKMIFEATTEGLQIAVNLIKKMDF